MDHGAPTGNEPNRRSRNEPHNPVYSSSFKKFGFDEEDANTFEDLADLYLKMNCYLKV